MSPLLIYCALFLSFYCSSAEDDFFAHYSELLFGNNSAFPSEGEEKGLFSDSQKRCYDDVVYVLRHLDSKWSIQMLDASGKVPSGTLLGDGLWMGKYEECRNVEAPPGDGNIRGLYCVATWNVSVPTNFHMPLQHLPIKTGICLPDSCDKLDIERDIKIIMYFISRLPFVQGHVMHLNSLNCKEKEAPLSSAALMFICVVGVYLLLVLTGSSVTVADYVLSTSKPRSANEERHSLLASFTNGVKFLGCFCLFTNGAKILDVSSSRGRDFPCIHGIRFLSMAWVILGHTYVHNLNVIGNFMDLLHSIDNLPFQVISQGTFSVDSFFLISGFLLGYLYLEESDKRNGNINWMGLILHRFLRIVPVYGVVLAFNTLLFPHTNSGPFWGDVSDHSECERRGWWNLLFINNFLPMDSMCMTWTWYLANDFQFFLFGLLLLHIFCVWRCPRFCGAVGGVVFAGSILLTGGISYAYDLMPPFAGMATASDYETYKNRLVLTWDLIYTKPYCRVGPYLVGLLLASFLNRSSDRHPLTRKWNACGWLLSSSCCLGLIYGVWFMRSDDTISPHLYNATARTLFSLGVAWVVYCCSTDNAGVAGRVLCWGAWVPLSRLSFCAYLLHPLLMSWYFDSRPDPVYFTHTNRVMLYFAFLVVSYAAAFLVSVTFEAPVINIEKMMLRRKSSDIEMRR